MPSPRDEIARAIARWEGLFQAQPQDAGNYVNGRLVGTTRASYATTGADSVLMLRTEATRAP